METKTFKTDLSCGSCIQTITPFLNSDPAIEKWEVDLEDARKLLKVSGPVKAARVRELMKQAGYEAEEISAAAEIPVAGVAPDARPGFFKTYRPLILIGLYLVAGVTLISYQTGDHAMTSIMSNFMGGFFLIFSFFKFLDLKGFAESYRTYDVVAKAVPAYGYVYPFVEFALGAFYVLQTHLFAVNLATVLVMGVSSIGVLQSVLNKRKIRCACLGTVFNLPMSTVTLVEDLLMVGMALAVLIQVH